MLTTADAVTLGICYLECSDSLTMEQIRTISLEKENRDLRGETEVGNKAQQPSTKSSRWKGLFPSRFNEM